jgi:hypothetical protein
VSVVGTWRVLFGAVVGALLAAATLSASPVPTAGGALAAGVKGWLGTWVVLTVLSVGEAMLRASTGPSGPSGAERPVSPVPAGGDRGGRAGSRWAGPLPVGVVATMLIAGLTVRSPGRLAATTVCFILLAVALAWMVQRVAGAGVAARIVAALGVLAAVAGAADRRVAPRIEEAVAGSTYRWTVGWPTPDWVLRHEVAPLAPLPDRPLVLQIPLAAPYEGPARVYVALNGTDLGPARPAARARLDVDLPSSLVANQARLVFDLRQRPVDPRLRITAHRWGQAATAGTGASSYADSAARWWPGTFDDATGRPQPGIYVVQVEPRG